MSTAFAKEDVSDKNVQLFQAAKDGNLDLESYPLEGAVARDRYTYRVKLKGKYPQFQYWLAMPFFAPVPPEADIFYDQPGMAEKNITLDWYPIGTGQAWYLLELAPDQVQANPHQVIEYFISGHPGSTERDHEYHKK